MRKFERLLPVGLCALVFGACNDGGDDPITPPEPEDPIVIPGTEWPEIPKSEPGSGAGTDGFNFGSATRPSGEARLGLNPAQSLFSGGEARCREGDFVLENDHIRTCISGPVSGDPFFATGGYVVDMVPTSNPIDDDIETFATASTLRAVSGDEFEIVSDGSDGGPAILRVKGVDLALKLVIGALGTDLLSPTQGVDFEVEYRLHPDSKFLEIVTWAKLDAQRARDLKVGTVALVGDQTWTWTKGFGEIRPFTAYDYFIVAGSRHSWGYYAEVANPMGGLEALSESLYLEVNVAGTLGNVSDAAFRRYLTVVENGSSIDIEEAFAGVRESSQAVEGHTISFTAESGAGWTNPRWSIERIVTDGDDVPEHFLRFTAASNARSLVLPEGRWRATPVGWPTGAPSVVEFEVTGDASVTLPKPALRPFRLEYYVDDVLTPMQIRYRDNEGGNSMFYYVPGKNEVIPVIAEGPFTLEAGGRENISFELYEADYEPGIAITSLEYRLKNHFSLDGWVSADFHQHAQRSADSSASNVQRVYGNLAAGLDIMAPSDHDVIEDFDKVVRDLGLSDAIHVFQGTEVSPLRGHMNVFPTPYNPLLDGFGSGTLVERIAERELRQRTTNEILADMRANGAEIVQINHGRDSSSALLNYVDWDFKTGTARAYPENMPNQFEAMEIFNAASYFCWLFRDWQAMFMHGQRVTGLGNSDTHNESSNAGYPRNYLYLGEAAITNEAIIDALKNQRVTVSGGIMIRFEDHIPGDVVTVNGTTTFDVRIDLPEWSNIEKVAIFINGIPAEIRDVVKDGRVPYPTTYEPIELSFDVNVSSDSTLTVLAWSNTAMTAVWPGKRPFGFTNPIFLDVGGNGWTAPGASAAAMAELPTGLSFCSANPKSFEYNQGLVPHSHDDHETGHTHSHRHADGTVHSH